MGAADYRNRPQITGQIKQDYRKKNKKAKQQQFPQGGKFRFAVFILSHFQSTLSFLAIIFTP